MKKLFISVPMKGRTEENIQRSREFLHRYAELMAGEELEVIDNEVTIIYADKSFNTSVYCLGKSISKMANADYVVGIDYGAEMWIGCDMERSVARSYGIPFFACPWENVSAFRDMKDVQRSYWEKIEKERACCCEESK